MGSVSKWLRSKAPHEAVEESRAARERKERLEAIRAKPDPMSDWDDWCGEIDCEICMPRA
jgi:hypothetical protein